MKCFIVLSALAVVALAKPSHHASHVVPLTYAAPLVHVRLAPGAPIGHDGRVVDTPEVAHAKAEHAAAHVNEKIALASETFKSADQVIYAAAPVHVAASHHSNAYLGSPVVAGSYHAVVPVAYAKLVPAAPIGHDGRVVDTLEVAHAKAEHAAAHVHEKLNLAYEEAKSSLYAAPHLVSAYSVGSYAPHYISAHQW